MAEYATWKSVLNKYYALEEHIQNHFYDFETLIEYEWEVILAYVFFKLEQAQVRTLFGGSIKLYRVNSEMAWKAVETEHISRNAFREFYKNIFNRDISATAIEPLRKAEEVRDKVIHGKHVPEKAKRNACGWALEYAEAFDKEVYELAKFHPFGSFTGITGKAKRLDKKTSRAVMKGFGFHIS